MSIEIVNKKPARIVPISSELIQTMIDQREAAVKQYKDEIDQLNQDLDTVKKLEAA